MSWYLSGGQVVVAPGGAIFDDGGGSPPPPASFDFYISTTGSDSSPGTLASPWAITGINSKRSTYAGKRVGIIAGTYDVSSLMTTDGTNPNRNPALNVNGGTSNAAITFIGACDASGNYSIGAATLDAMGASGFYGGGNSNTNAIMGCNSTVTNRGFWTVAGLRFIGYSMWAFHVGNSPSGSTNIHDWTMQDLEFTGQNDQNNTLSSGTNIASIIVYMASNGLITNCYLHDNIGWTDPNHFSAVYQWGLPLTHDITYDKCTFVNTGNIHSKEATQYNNTVQYCYIDMTNKNPSGGSTQNYAGIFGFNSDGGAGTLSTFHHNIIINSFSYICLSNDTGQNGWTTPVQIYNNTFVASANQAAGNYFCLQAFETTAGTHPISGWNNLFWDNGFTPASTYSYTTFNLDLGSGWDYNVYGGHNHYGTVPSGTQSSAGFVSYSSLGTWQAATGADTNASSSTASPVVGTGTGPAQYQLNATGKAYTPKPATTTYVGAWDGTATQIGSTLANNDGTFIPNASLGVTWSGSFTNGSTMTVTIPGGGLGARTNALPRYYYPFGEDGSTNLSTHPTLSRMSNTLVSPVGGNTFVQSSVTPVNAPGAVQWIPVTAAGASHAPAAFTAQVATVPGGAGTWTYAFMKRYWAFSGGPGNVKVWRMWNNAITWSVMFLANSASSEWGMGSDTQNGTSTGVAHPNFFNAGNFAWPAVNAWHTDEWYFQQNTFNTFDGIHQWARQAENAFELAGRWNIVGGGSNGTTDLTTLFLDEFTLQNNSIPNGTTDIGYYGALMVDDSILQLLATDEGSTYLTNYCYNVGVAQFNREFQPQTVRSDTTITFVVRQGSHASLSGKNLLAVTGYGTAINLGVGA